MNRAVIEADIEAGLVECSVPAHLRDGLRGYFLYRQPTGDFLRAALANDFAGAVLRADPITERGLHGLAQFLQNFAPERAHGSPAKVAAWLAAA